MTATPGPDGRHAAAETRPAAAASGRCAGSLRRPGISRRRDGRDRGAGRGQQAGPVPALSRQARPLPRPARRERRRAGRDRPQRAGLDHRQQAAGDRHTSPPSSISSRAPGRPSAWSSSQTCATSPPSATGWRRRRVTAPRSSARSSGRTLGSATTRRTCWAWGWSAWLRPVPPSGSAPARRSPGRRRAAHSPAGVAGRSAAGRGRVQYGAPEHGAPEH